MICPICKHYPEVVCTAYSHNPFIDGRTYDAICFVCSQVPKTWDFDESTNELVIYSGMDPQRLCSVKDMMEDGFDREEIEASIRAVRRCLKSAKTIIVSELSHNVFDHLYLGDGPLKYAETT